MYQKFSSYTIPYMGGSNKNSLQLEKKNQKNLLDQQISKKVARP